MINKFIDPNAKAALNQMKMEIGNELGIDDNMSSSEISSYENGEITEDLGMILWEYGDLSGLLRGNQNNKINKNILKKETGYFSVTLGKKD